MSGWTIAFQIVNFLVLALLLRRFLFKPIMAMIAKRQDIISKAAADTERAHAEIAALQAKAQAAATELEGERTRLRAETVSIVEQDRKATLASALRDADALREKAAQDIESEREKAADTMARGAVELGTALAQRLLQQVSSPSIAEAFLERLCHQLDVMPDERIRELLADLGAGELLLATAPALAPGDEERWRTRVAAGLRDAPRVRLVGDDSLIAGAELRFPHTTISFCWRDGLKAAREELVHDAPLG